MKSVIVSIAVISAGCVVQADTYALRGHDAYDSSTYKSHSSFADQNDSSKKGAGWVNVDDATDVVDFPSAGNDYVSDGYTLRTTESTAGCTFAGSSLKLTTPDFPDVSASDLGTKFGRLMFKNKGSSTVAIDDLVLENAAITFSDTYASLGTPVLAGKLTIASGFKGFIGTPASGDTGDRRGDIRSTLVGAGELVVCFASSDTQAVFSGDLSGFTGRVTLDHDGTIFSGVAGGGRMIVADTATWFGNPSAEDPASVAFNKGGRLCFQGDVASTGANRGFTFKSKSATLDVADGKSVTIDGQLSGSVGFNKTGDGTLTLSGDSPNFSGTIVVSAGRLVAASENALGTAEVVTGGSGVFVPYSGGEEGADPVTCTWTGGGETPEWSLAENWSDGNVPRRIDTAVFTDAGLTAGCQVRIHGAAKASNLVIRTALAFSFVTDADGSLMLGGLERADIEEATEGFVDIRVPVSVLGDADGVTVWSIAGSNGVRLYGDLTKIGATAVTLRKRGNGRLDLYAANTAYRGPWIVEAGKVVSNGSGAFGGTITVGGGEEGAELAQGVDHSLVDASVTVLANGTFTSSKYSEWGRLSSLTIRDGGSASLLGYYADIVQTVTLRGSVLTGQATTANTLKSESSPTTSVLDGIWDVASYSDREILVEDGDAPVDLRVKEVKSNDPKTYKLYKKGAGTLRTTADCGNLNWAVQISAGTWLVDNPSQYGLGKNAVTVAKGATLGGRGFVGASSVLTDKATVTLASGTESSFATLSPGSVDETTGAHLNGTLTVASETVPNDVTFGAFAHFNAGLPSRSSGTGAADRLVVHGKVTLGEGAVLDLAATSPVDAREIRTGTYVILHADAGVEGTFGTVVRPPKGVVSTVRYVTGEGGTVRDIEVSLSRGLVIVVK